MLSEVTDNLSIVLLVLSFFSTLFMIFCRNFTHFNGIKEEDDQDFFYAFFNRLYFVVVTAATIGYGDISPASMSARFLTMCIILTIFVLILKAFDNLIDHYKKNLSEYVDKTKEAAKSII